jgi:hypothetical protein
MNFIKTQKHCEMLYCDFEMFFYDPRILKVEIIVEHSIPIQRKPKHPKEKLSPSSIKWAGKMDIVKTGVSKKSKFK